MCFLHFTARLILWVSVLLTAGYQLQESCASGAVHSASASASAGQFLNTAQLEGAAHVETIKFVKILRCLGFKDIRQQILISLTPRYIETQLVGNVHKVP